MYKQQKINMEMVINALMASASASAGISAADIIALTGLSSSTVYRIIAKHPAIKSMNIPGRKQLYYLDHEVLTTYRPVGEGKRKRRVDLTADLIRHWETIDKAGVGVLLNEYMGGIPDSAVHNVRLAKLIITANAINQMDSPSPEHIDAARSAIRELVSFSGAMHIVYSDMLRHPNFKSDDSFKSIYPKES